MTTKRLPRAHSSCMLALALLALGCGGEPVEPEPREVTIIGRVLHNGDPVGLDGASVRFWTGGGGDGPCNMAPDDDECVLTLTTDEDGFYRIALEEESPFWEIQPCSWWARALLPNGFQSPARPLFLDRPLASACRGILVATDLDVRS